MKTAQLRLPTAASLFRRGWAAALVTGLAVLGTGAPARADTTFAQFDEGSNGGTQPFRFTFNGPGASFTATTVGNFQFLVPGTVITPQPANIVLTSTATTPAVAAGPVLSQPINGASNTLSFRRVSDNANLLTVTFTGNLTGLNGDVSATLSANTANGQTVTYTSDFFNFAGTTSRSLGLNVTAITPDFTQNANGFLNNFVADATGGFSSSPAPVLTRPVPEPGSVVLFGIGLSASALVAARRGRALRV